MLSKSKYLQGLRCRKRLWLATYKKELATPVHPNRKAIFEQGHRIGEMAQQRYPGGHDASPEDHTDLSDSIAMTAEWMAQGVDVIYEAAFAADGLYAAIDILVKDGTAWRAIEVKSSTSVKDIHLDDAAIQYHALKAAGTEVSDMEILYIDNTYVRQGALDVDRLFKSRSVLEQVIQRQEDIPEQLVHFNHLLTKDTAPEVAIGAHCTAPHPCPFKAHCWQLLPPENIFEVSGIQAKALQDLVDRDIWKMDNIPADFEMSRNQRIQVAGQQTGKERFDARAVTQFLSKWEYPLYFFDFESVNPAIPPFNGSKAFQQLPFQYSLHVMAAPQEEVSHFECLPSPSGDPRQELVDQMLQELGTSGSIVAYNMTYEKQVIKRLMHFFPERSKELRALLPRFVDIMIPFQKKWVYLPEMKGRHSIKVILPALCPQFSYDDLSIQDGRSASSTYQRMLEGQFDGDIEKTLQDLKDYCALDTLAMVEIFRYLQGRIRS